LTQALFVGAALPAAAVLAAGADCTFFGAILISFSLVWANAAVADIATPIAKAETSALPLARNTAFAINLKILACALKAGRSGPFPSSSRRRKSCVDPATRRSMPE
jgi:apolipoprotein N-acyltransferase